MRRGSARRIFAWARPLETRNMQQPNMLIRSLVKDLDLDSVLTFYDQAPDYWELAEGQKPGPEQAISFCIDTSPNCDPNRSFRLELFFDDRLSGLVELSFGFPKIGDPYLGFMLLGP